MTSAERNERYAGWLVAGVAFLVYANTLANGFVWDDSNVILQNHVLRGSPLALFRSIDTTTDVELLPYYRPITLLSFMIEGWAHGFNPAIMHLGNVLLHAASAFLFFRLARSIAPDTTTALLAGLLFAVHPVNTETVGFISARNNLLAALFVLSAYAVYRRGVLEEKTSLACAGGAVLLAGLFSKESALMVLPFLAALEIPGLRSPVVPRARLRAATRLFFPVAASLAYIVARWSVLSGLGIQTSLLPGVGTGHLEKIYLVSGLGERLIDNVYIIPQYMLTLAWPVALAPRYLVPDDLHLLALPLLAAWLGIGLALAWLLTRGRTRATVFGLLWFLLFWVPVSGIVWFPSASLADRFLYLPAMGLWIVIADQVGQLGFKGSRLRSLVWKASAAALLVLAILTIRRNLDWRDDVTLYTRFVEQYPDNVYAFAGLGHGYYARDPRTDEDLDRAEDAFRKALALDPNLLGGNIKMGNIRMIRGDLNGALYYYSIALTIFPLDREARLNRAITYEKLGRNRDAAEDFRLFLSAPGKDFAAFRPYAEERLRAIVREAGGQ